MIQPKFSKRTARGFTLVEIVAVLALVVAIVALTAGLMSAGLPGQQLRGGREAEGRR